LKENSEETCSKRDIQKIVKREQHLKRKRMKIMCMLAITYSIIEL